MAFRALGLAIKGGFRFNMDWSTLEKFFKREPNLRRLHNCLEKSSSRVVRHVISPVSLSNWPWVKTMVPYMKIDGMVNASSSTQSYGTIGFDTHPNQTCLQVEPADPPVSSCALKTKMERRLAITMGLQRLRLLREANHLMR